MMHSDPLDRAQELEERQRQEAIARVRSQTSPPDLEGFEDCENCGNEIPEARRRAMPSARLCVFCQAKSE